jgi:hypothetical protein
MYDSSAFHNRRQTNVPVKLAPLQPYLKRGEGNGGIPTEYAIDAS